MGLPSAENPSPTKSLCKSSGPGTSGIGGIDVLVVVLRMLVVDVLAGVVELAATVVDGASIDVVVVAGAGVESIRAGSTADSAVGD
jgi:hypothetical protein